MRDATSLLTRLLVTERFAIGGIAALAAPTVSSRMFGVRHVALGAALWLVRHDRKRLAKMAAVNAAVEFSDAYAMLRARIPLWYAAGAIVGGLGCAALALTSGVRPRP